MSKNTCNVAKVTGLVLYWFRQQCKLLNHGLSTRISGTREATLSRVTSRLPLGHSPGPRRCRFGRRCAKARRNAASAKSRPRLLLGRSRADPHVRGSPRPLPRRSRGRGTLPMQHSPGPSRTDARIGAGTAQGTAAAAGARSLVKVSPHASLKFGCSIRG